MLLGERSAAEREVAAGERLLWKGRPATGIRFRAANGVQFAVNLVALAFAVGSFYNAPAGLTDNIHPIFIVLFGLLVVYSLVGGFVVDAWQRKRTSYALTDRRAIIARDGFTGRVESIAYRDVPNVGLSEQADKTGTITFGDSPALWSQYNSKVPAFDTIPNARAVYDKILQAKKAG